MGWRASLTTLATAATAAVVGFAVVPATASAAVPTARPPGLAVSSATYSEWAAWANGADLSHPPLGWDAGKWRYMQRAMWSEVAAAQVPSSIKAELRADLEVFRSADQFVPPRQFDNVALARRYSSYFASQWRAQEAGLSAQDKASGLMTDAEVKLTAADFTAMGPEGTRAYLGDISYDVQRWGPAGLRGLGLVARMAPVLDVAGAALTVFDTLYQLGDLYIYIQDAFPEYAQPAVADAYVAKVTQEACPAPVTVADGSDWLDRTASCYVPTFRVVATDGTTLAETTDVANPTECASWWSNYGALAGTTLPLQPYCGAFSDVGQPYAPSNAATLSKLWQAATGFLAATGFPVLDHIASLPDESWPGERTLPVYQWRDWPATQPDVTIVTDPSTLPIPAGDPQPVPVPVPMPDPATVPQPPATQPEPDPWTKAEDNHKADPYWYPQPNADNNPYGQPDADEPAPEPTPDDQAPPYVEPPFNPIDVSDPPPDTTTTTPLPPTTDERGNPLPNGPTANCPCPIADIFIPPLDADPCGTFPFGVFCWLGGAISGMLTQPPTPPSVTFGALDFGVFLGVHLVTPEFTLDAAELPTPILQFLNVLRIALSFLAWVLFLIYFGPRLMGARGHLGGGNGGE